MLSHFVVSVVLKSQNFFLEEDAGRKMPNVSRFNEDIKSMENPCKECSKSMQGFGQHKALSWLTQSVKLVNTKR